MSEVLPPPRHDADPKETPRYRSPLPTMRSPYNAATRTGNLHTTSRPSVDGNAADVAHLSSKHCSKCHTVSRPISSSHGSRPHTADDAISPFRPPTTPPLGALSVHAARIMHVQRCVPSAPLRPAHEAVAWQRRSYGLTPQRKVALACITSCDIDRRGHPTLLSAPTVAHLACLLLPYGRGTAVRDVATPGPQHGVNDPFPGSCPSCG